MSVVAVLTVIGIQFLAGEPLLRAIMAQEVRDSGSSWAAHIFKQIEAGTVSDAATDAGSDTSYANLAGALEAGLYAGVIHRAIIMSRECNCQIDVDGRLLSEGENAIETHLQGFFQGSAGPEIRPAAMAESNWAKLDGAPAWSPPHVAFHTSNEPGQPNHAAELTFLRSIGEEDFALCLIIDVTGTVSRLRVSLAMGALILTLTLIGAYMIVNRIWTRSSQAVHLSEKQARFLAEHDPLTGLLNRFGFGARAEALLKTLEASGRQAFLFQIDADKFKEINDIYGHPTGDRVIQAIGDMLKSAFPSDALVGRLGGDEFAVMVSETAIDGTMDDFMRSLPTGTDITTDGGDKLIGVSTSVGFSVYPDDAKSLGDLMKAADLALYAVKNAGRNSVGAYRRDMTKALERRHWEVQGIRDAIRAGHLQAYYQPLLNARTGRVEGLEALARWNHASYGVLGPDRFNHALQDVQVSTEITHEILRQAADDLRTWWALGYDFSVGLNIGEADLRNPDLPDLVKSTLAARGLPPRALAIEVTETALTGTNSAAARPLLQRYRENGGAVALDDFGTGSSSITLLKDMPYSAVKIDRSFIKDLTRNKADLAIVRSIVRLSRELGFKIVAEGIETREQAQLLRKLRVDLLQGFLFSRPLPAREVTELLAWSSPPPKPAESAAA